MSPARTAPGPGWRIVADDIPDIEAARQIEQALVNFNRTAAPAPIKPLGIFARDDAEQIIGGLTGFTYWDWLFIAYFWVEEGWRGKGAGRDIIYAAEELARRRGCHSAWLDTFEFQAPGFYQKLGYEEFGRLEDYPIGTARHFMKKKLVRNAII